MAIESLASLAFAVISVAFGIGTASFFIRLYCRAILLKSFGWDDAISTFLLFVNSMQQAILYMFLHYGCGTHATTLSTYQLERINTVSPNLHRLSISSNSPHQWLFVEEIFYMFTHWTIKQAFLLFYLRLSPSVAYRYCVIGAMVVNTVFTIINWLLAFLQCTPFDAIFHPALHPDANCIDKNILLMGPSVLNIITDVIILALPIPTVWSLQMPMRRKIAVIAVVSFGASAVIVAMCRFIVLRELGTTEDPSYTLGKMIVVAALEIQFAIIAVNLPSMKVLWTRMTGGSSAGQSEPISNSKGYKLSSMERHDGSKSHWSKRSKSGIVADSITHHIGGITATDSEEELWHNGHQNRIHVTRTVEVAADDSGSK
ncbi:hypothetical protein F5883DRAFT_504563 [Neofusicoccum parvum]|uniref:Uncharacterized protein n=1 Tax=Neofusicoccum parvum TaxID=310453 RepID=A0ACB5S820_9PEZI|nr:hypothetical protein F5883DRAFT_504563 [Neofusicoccum parvum]